MNGLGAVPLKRVVMPVSPKGENALYKRSILSAQDEH